jgi:DNA-binding NtrC family response regulator
MAFLRDSPISILVADDEEDQRLLLRSILEGAEDARHVVTTASDGPSALTALREQVYDVALLDLSMPGLDGLEVLEAIGGDPIRPQVIFVSGHGTVETATHAMRLGAYDFVEKPVDGDRLVALVWKAAEARRLQSRSERMVAAASRDTVGIEIVTDDDRIRDTLALLERVAPSDVSVLVTGESGTGKELVARELHRLSGRQEEPLVALNCAAVSESLAESELFGHEKGSFTGAAARKIGLIELADGGTLFLDEVGDLDAGLQAKLLRAIETRSFWRVGGVKEIPTDFRLVSATHQPLHELVEQGTFRGDLYYRINAVVLDLPPLRERPGDILLLVRHFLGQFRPGEAGLWTITPDAVATLHAYAWPGNVRELRNVIERAALLCQGRTIRAVDLGASLAEPASETDTGGGVTGDAGLPTLRLNALEEIAVREALDAAEWHQGRAAELLGVSARTLHRKIRAFGLRRPGPD